MSNVGFDILLWVSGENSRARVLRWLEEERRLRNPKQIKVVASRPSNSQLWLRQLFGLNASVPKTDFFYCSLFPGLKISRDCKRILRLHDPFGISDNWVLTFLDKSGRFKLRVAKALRTKALVENLYSSILVFNSEYTKKRFREIYGIASNDTVIHSLVQFDGLLSPPLPYKRHYFLAIGGSRQRKQPEKIINVWAKSRLPSVVDLVIVGKVPMHLLSDEAVCQLNLGKLRLIERVDGSGLKSLTENCMATLFYSLGEGWGQPLAESVYCGKVVICNDLEVFHEVAGNFARFFPTDNPNQIVPLAEDTILDSQNGLIDELEIREFGQRYGMDKLGKDWLQLLA